MDAQTILPFNTQWDTGATCRLGKTFTDVDNSLFAGVTGNLSPLHMDEHHCRARGLDGRLLFEALIAGLASASAAELTGGKYTVGKMSMEIFSLPMLGATYHAEATMGRKDEGFCEVSVQVTDPESGGRVATVEFQYKRL